MDPLALDTNRTQVVISVVDEPLGKTTPSQIFEILFVCQQASPKGLTESGKDRLPNGKGHENKTVNTDFDKAEEQRHRDEQNHGEADALKEKLERNQ
ncbi:hypothetical protein TELCIR_04376 [Teladorsagia circumcincta]|uniref:Uncharacterized protein n=1 Tax=Teladorsagia circumcincta TaxID=45464 RepID=A0A2G9UVV8_TELCI|nr:hypothetical protein TELCIR_04376 [Teladorsagia circumcincta]